MGDLAAKPAGSKVIDPRWLWGLRIATGLCFVLTLVLSLLPELVSARWVFDLPFFASLSFPAFYALALWLLRGNPPSKFALALAVGSGTVWFLLGLAGTVATLWEMKSSRPDWEALWVLLAVLAVQGTYGAMAARAYFRLGKERADWGRLASGFGLAVLVVAAVAWSMPNKIRSGPHAMPVAYAVGSLRIINTAEVTYASTYEGYSPNLAVLGPPPEGKPLTATAAGLIDEEVARGVKNGYRFTYKPGPPDAKGQITSYTLCAQPVERSQQLRLSFFTDETGVIRQTGEDRCATAQDPPIAG